MSRAADLAALIVDVNTTEAKTDELTGKTTAGSIAVTAEGNTTTTNLQQGLIKQWVMGATDASLDDSFNTSSGTDNAQGQYTYAFSNNMNSANYSIQCTCHSGAIVETDTGNQAAASYKFQCFTRPSLDAFSDVEHFGMVAGDLAQLRMMDASKQTTVQAWNQQRGYKLL